MPQLPIEDLLSKLDSPNAEEAWTQFLSDYSSHVYQVVRRHESDLDDIADCFQFVCERLIENRAKRLRKFKGEGTATFATWLRAIVRNLCVDWHRQKFGRHRQFRSISRLPVFDQEVFRLAYERATPPEECLRLLAAEFPNISAKQINESRARIEEVLTVQQRWLLANRTAARNGREATDLEESDAYFSLKGSGPDPEVQAIENEHKRKLERALAQLDAQDRLLIRLRFEEDLTLSQAAELLGLGNAQRADRKVKEILGRLFEVLQKK
ncbi:MAG TPA: sigma-70 family RNA polymerase sigma factor [Pyrinomonadaceae bacterium]|jgi:RNA polymerase sigma factor, sigma-70 family|nr:sigma-70 family RNA polymerase sigma factor [Pyrinomonadaceae bacterium]